MIESLERVIEVRILKVTPNCSVEGGSVSPQNFFGKSAGSI
jgi:hypothetical protein